MITIEKLEYLLRVSEVHCCIVGCPVCRDREIYQTLLQTLQDPIDAMLTLLPSAFRRKYPNAANPLPPHALEQLRATALFLHSLQGA